MEDIERLALEVGEITFVGGEHESVHGEPKDLDCDEDMHEWMKGLREGGGGGYVVDVNCLVQRNMLKLISDTVTS